MCSSDEDEKYNSENEEKNEYKCNRLNTDGTLCNKIYTISSSYNTHIREYHEQKNKFYCDFIDKNGNKCTWTKHFTNQSKLNRHINVVHLNKKDFICDYILPNENECGKAFAEKNKLVNHLKTHNKQKQGKINLIKKNKELEDEELKDEELEDEELKDEELEDEELEDEELEDEELEDKIKCNICDNEFKGLVQLKIHTTKVHKINSSNKCTNLLKNGKVCEKKFKYPYLLEKHILRIHNNKSQTYNCEHKLEDGKICNKKYANPEGLSKHIRIDHEKRYQFYCNFIDKNGNKCIRHDKPFKELSKLKRHTKSIHLNIKNFICDFKLENGNICNKQFDSKDHLDDHIKRHNGVKQYICEYTECKEKDIRFVTSKELESHINSKHIEKTFEYICNYILEEGEECKKKFNDENSLNIHKKIHTGEKPFNCENCNYETYSKSNLTRHVKYHLGIKNHKCTFTLCDSSFVTSSELKKHFNSVHSEESIRKHKISENKTYEMLLSYLKDIKREQYVSFICNNDSDKKCAKIDFIYIQNGIIYAIENDEEQHKHYEISCEIRRMIDVKSVWIETGNMLPVVWIRYNPDVFKINDVTQKIPKEKRIKKIVDFIEKNSKVRENVPDLSIYYFYYDLNENKQLCIFNDPEYSKEVKQYVHSIY